MIFKIFAYGVLDLFILSPLSMIYSLVIVIRGLLYDFGFIKTLKLPRLVISVGNISAGGSGKTPVVLMILEALKDKKAAVLTRGYGSQIARKNLYPQKVTTEARPEYYGDEPSLVFSKFKDQTIVLDSRRYRGGLMALSEDEGLELFILDDGYQHRKLHRDFNVLVFDVHTYLSKPGLLPKGRLREGLPSLKRADYILLSKWQHIKNTEVDRLIQKIRVFSKAPIEKISFEIKEVKSDHRQTLTSEYAGPIIAFAGIGAPDVFLKDLKAYFSNNKNIKLLKYSDHHQFKQEEIQDILKEAASMNAKVVCTEKDYIKLRALNLTQDIFFAEQRVYTEGNFLNELVAQTLAQ